MMESQNFPLGKNIMPSLDQIDLNLLRILSILLDVRSLTRTARLLGISQPSVSRALRTLREVFDDPLLVKTKTGMTLTQRAEALREPLDTWLSGARAILRSPSDNPAQRFSGRIRVATTDFGVLSTLMPAMPSIIEKAPNLLIDICELDPDNLNQLSSGAVDLVISGFDPEPGRSHEQHLFREQFCCVLREEHPLASKPADQPLTLNDLLAWPHILLSVHGVSVDPLAPLLADAQQERQVVAILPYLVSALLLLQNTNAILISPRRSAAHLAQPYGLITRDAPIDLGFFDYWLFWHERNRRDGAINWLIEELSAHASPLSAE